jgi:hypothetical protein
MPDFTAFQPQYQAKPQVVADGEIISVSSVDGYTVTSTLSSYTAFHSNPVRSATGVWSVTMKDVAFKVTDIDVKTMLPSGHYLSTQLLPNTLDSNGHLVINWVFNSAGTPSDLPEVSGCAFLIHVEYGWCSF